MFVNRCLALQGFSRSPHFPSTSFPSYHNNKKLAIIQRLLESTRLWHLFNFRQALSRDRQAEQRADLLDIKAQQRTVALGG